MNYKRKILGILLLVGLMVQIFPTHALFDEENLVSRWEVNQWNEVNHVTWDWPSVNFTVDIGSLINYTISTYEPANFTNPSSGIIEIGNHTTETTNNKTGEVLTLSIYGWFPGLITSSSNWTLQKQVAQQVAQGQWMKGDLEIHELTYNYTGLLRQAINFSYQQNSTLVNQNTTVIYDLDTGVLLEGFTEIQFTEYYVLQLKLVYSDLITESNANLTTQFFFVYLITIVFLSLFWGVLRKKK